MSTASPENEFVTPAGVLWDDPEPGRTWTVSLVGIIILAALIIAAALPACAGPRRGEHDHLRAGHRLRIGQHLELRAIDRARLGRTGIAHAERNAVALGGPSVRECLADIPCADDCDVHVSFSRWM